MKLLSIYGAHSESKRAIFPRIPKVEVRPGILILEEDWWKIAAVAVFTVAICGWMLNGIDTASDMKVIPAQIEAVATTAPIADEIEIIAVDQIEALAMGIDAVISSECKGEWVSDTTLVMVANVILNRTIDVRFPDTVDQVLCQPYQFSCFSESGMKWVGKAANDLTFRDRCMDAAKAAMNGERMLNYGVVYVSGAKQGTVEAQLDGLYFCR